VILIRRSILLLVVVRMALLFVGGTLVARRGMIRATSIVNDYKVICNADARRNTRLKVSGTFSVVKGVRHKALGRSL